MNAQDYRIAIAKLGMSQRRAARFFEAGQAAGPRWAKDGPPAAVAMMLKLMIALHVRPDWVDFWLGRRKDNDSGA